MEELVADLKSGYCIEPDRVFLTGFSNGTVFANKLACRRELPFRAYAPVEGVGNYSNAVFFRYCR